MELRLSIKNDSTRELTLALEPHGYFHPLKKDKSLDLVITLKRDNGEIDILIKDQQIMFIEPDEVSVELYEDGKLIY